MDTIYVIIKIFTWLGHKTNPCWPPKKEFSAMEKPLRNQTAKPTLSVTIYVQLYLSHLNEEQTNPNVSSTTGSLQRGTREAVQFTVTLIELFVLPKPLPVAS